MKLNSSLVKQLIKEAIADRIKMIDEAGDIAALEAKISKVEEDIKDAMAVKSSLMSMDGLKYYVSPEIVGDMMDDMEVSIKELQTKKKDLEDQKKAMAKNTKGPKKSEKKEDKKELKENNITSPDSKKVADNMKIGSRDFTYKDITGKEKFVSADNLEQAKERVKRFNSKIDLSTVKERTPKIKEVNERKLTTKQSNKKENVVKSMKKSFKGPKSDMYAIATSVAKKSK
jgi:hypothetical protein